MAVLIVATVMLFVIVFRNIVPMWRSGPKRLFWINTVMTATGYVLIVMSGFDLHTPSLMKPVDALFRSLFHL